MRILILILLVFSPCFSHAKLYDPKTFLLPNGLTVVVLSNPQAPVVNHTMWFKTGANEDPLGKSGIAHFLEHMMFKGTKKVSGKEYTQTLRRLGVSFNATTSSEFTNYISIAHKKYLDKVMELEADRYQNLSFPDSEIKTERDVILQERSMRIDSVPLQKLVEGVMRNFYWNQPQGIPVIGWRHEMKTLNRDDVFDFYTHWYAPNNAILVLAGDITVEEAKSLTEKYYGSWKNRALPPRKGLQEPPHHDLKTHISLEHPQVQVPYLLMTYSAPSIQNYKKSLALEIATHVLSGGATNLMTRELVEGKHLFEELSIHYESGSTGAIVPLIVFGITKDRKKLEESQQFLQKWMKELAHKGLPKNLIEDAKKNIVLDLKRVTDNSLAGVDHCAKTLILGRTLEELESIEKDVEKLTPEDINKALEEVFAQAPLGTATLLPPKDSKPSPVSSHSLPSLSQGIH